ncbi:calcium-binding protein [Sphingosinicella terrae]|uniref:calcium-binding protein n=1 Tax=Sphingosinicella terrae TaxID=2172047 RepID=UPI0013B40F85|nr:hypothetical protein [Sphingosinicella terrae]
MGALIVATAVQASETVTYTYDALGRLVKVDHSGTVNDDLVSSYQYDAAGNRTLVQVTSLNCPVGILDGQTLNGTVEDDVLQGGAGNDSLYGSSGNDRLYGHDGDDLLTGAWGFDELYGGTGSDALYGNDGNDQLDGGAGADCMSGGDGHDVYVVDSVNDVTLEGGSSGNDTVESSVDYGLRTHIERLVLTGTAGIDGRGNTGDNVLTGNSGANLLNGGRGDDRIDGGAGNDRIYGSEGDDSLTGGSGNDDFLFNTAPEADNVDRIYDFSPGSDRIRIARYAYTAIGALGTLDSARFRIGTAAADSDDRIIYDPTSGQVYYDPDGSGAAAAIHFATVNPGTALAYADFNVYD